MGTNRNRSQLAIVTLFVVAGLLLTACGAGKPKTFTIGVINSVPSLNPLVDGFKEDMAKSGYVEGENITYVYEGPVGRDLLATVAQGLVASKVDLILCITTPAAVAIKEATAGSDIPVVFAVVINPVGAGIVASAERPGENITGIESSQGEGVKLEWLTKIAPDAKRVFVPYNPDDASGKLALAQLQQVAPKLGLELVTSETRTADEVTAAIASIPADVDAIFMVTDSINATRRSDWGKAALAHKLPLAVPPGGEPTEEGALFTFGFSPFVVGTQAARLADQILKGTAPADLPVETPELFLSINLKTAQAIGLDIPDDILRQAATVIR